MEEQTTNEQTQTLEVTNEVMVPGVSRSSIFRPLWWILQSIIVGIWKMLLSVVLIWQFVHILFTGKTHTWSNEFLGKFINHVVVWTKYTFWIQDDRPEIIEY